MREFTIVGLPIVERAVGDAFLSFVNDPRPVVCLATSVIDPGRPMDNHDYVSAKAGYDRLALAGFDFVPGWRGFRSDGRTLLMVDGLWKDASGGRSRPIDVAAAVLKIASELLVSVPRVAFVTTGDPLLYNGVTEGILSSHPETPVLRSKSSAELAYEALEEKGLSEARKLHIVRNLWKFDFVDDSVNTVGCISGMYQSQVATDRLLSLIREEDRMYTVHVGEETLVQPIDTDGLRIALKHHSSLLQNATLAVVRR